MSVLLILGRKCTLAASHAAPNIVSLVEHAPRALLTLGKDGTGRQTDGRTDAGRCITLTAITGKCNNL